ncbi:hypothetical protein EDD80_11383 [Anseongella ginsenosidimutans]|uniref:Uncharacterized protein n=2 Tax=Anseongella ginsenosidimutans TaxID=496056 RepID=A0A4R3KM83_9SPHI|nr:hypothetical protein EDD80_11383 [Anseongella ginsenosidimutans]
MHKRSRILLAAILAPALFFSSCEKDDPVPEPPLEEYDGVTVTFTEVEIHGDHHHDIENPETAEIKFRYENGAVVIDGSDHLHLTAGKTFLQTISILDDGKTINDDFDPALHQFFFTGAPDNVLDYAYIDKDSGEKGVGFEGYLTVLAATEVGFDFKLALVHFHSAGSKPEIAWNDAGYAGKIADVGHHDFEGSFELHPVQGGHDDDDHGEH